MMESRPTRYHVKAKGRGVFHFPKDCNIFDTINIFYRDEMQEFFVPPYFKLPLKNTILEKSKSAQFQCIVGGYPRPDCEWYKGSVPILSSDNGDSTNGDTKYECVKPDKDGKIVLIIKNPCLNDQEPYACKIKNQSGEAWSISYLDKSETDVSAEIYGKSGKKCKIQVKETIEIQHRQPVTSGNLNYIDNETHEGAKNFPPSMTKDEISVLCSSPQRSFTNGFFVNRCRQPKNQSMDVNVPSRPRVDAEALNHIYTYDTATIARPSSEARAMEPVPQTDKPSGHATLEALYSTSFTPADEKVNDARPRAPLEAMTPVTTEADDKVTNPGDFGEFEDTVVPVELELQQNQPQNAMVDEIEFLPHLRKIEAESTSDKLDGIIEKLVKFSDEEFVLVSSLAIDKDTVEAFDGSGHNQKIIDEILLSSKRGRSTVDGLLEDDDFSNSSMKSQKPKFVLGLENTKIIAGQEVYLNVSVTGYPPPKLFWFKNGLPLNMDAGGIATDRLIHGEATYSCIARNLAGEATTFATVHATAVLNSNESPLVAKEYLATKSQTAASTEHSCTKVASASLVDYLRSKANEIANKLYTRDILPATRAGSMLSLSSISTANFETAEEDLWSSDAQWDESYTTVEEDFESADCYFSSDLLKSFSSEYPDRRCSLRKMLTLDASFSQEKSFELDDRSEVSTPVPMTSFQSPMGTIPPMFLVMPKDFTFAVGHDFEMVCCVAGDPQPALSWYRNGVKIAEGTQVLNEVNAGRFQIFRDIKLDDTATSATKYSFVVKDCKATDAGEYSVTAANHSGTVTSSCCGRIGSNEAISTSSEFSQPLFVSNINDVDGLVGADATTMFCVSGQPEPDVTVLHKNEEVFGDKYLLEKMSGGRYIITVKNLQHEDEGEIKICAVNVIGYCETIFEVFVDDESDVCAPAENRSLFAQDSFDEVFAGTAASENLTQQSAPHFNEITEDVTAVEGSKVKFIVAVYGWPTPDVSWKRNEEPITVNERIRLESTDYGVHALLIMSVEKSDFGVYSCIAKNAIGEISCKAELLSSNVNSEDSTSNVNELNIGRRCKDHYKMEDIIGGGTFSIVCSVRPLGNNVMKYAAKYIQCGNTLDRKDFMDEVNILKRLSHPNIIAYKDHFITKKQIILLTEYAHIEWFDFLLDESTMPEMEIAKQVQQICAGLNYLHNHKVVHLNIKPENILLDSIGKQMKIIDFGNAKQLTDDGVTFDFGDPEFIAPEIVNGKPIAIVTDMWSLGITIYVALSGISPFHGDSDFNTLENVKDGKISYTKSLAKISGQAVHFIKQMLVVDMSTRMSSSQALEHDWLKVDMESLNEDRLPIRANSGYLPGSRLKYFCSRRRWQRSLVGPRTSLTIRSISSLINKEYDSLSIIVPRQSTTYHVSSSTVTESDDEDPVQQSWVAGATTSLDLQNGIKEENVMNHGLLNSGGENCGEKLIEDEKPAQQSADCQTKTRLPNTKPGTAKINMNVIGKKVSFEEDTQPDIGRRSKGPLISSVVEPSQNQDDVILSKTELSSQEGTKRALKKKSLTKFRRQTSMSKRPDWTSSESDDTIHNDDKNTEFDQTENTLGNLRPPSTEIGQRSYARRILKSGFPRSPPKIRVQGLALASRNKTPSPGYRESPLARAKPLLRGMSLDIENVSKLRSTSEDVNDKQGTTTASQRRAEMRRGSSVESVLSKKLNSHFIGLRGPLLEKNRVDEPTAGMTLRRSQPTMTRGGSLTYSWDSSNPNTPTIDVTFEDHLNSSACTVDLVPSSNGAGNRTLKRPTSASSRSPSSIRNDRARARSPSKWKATECYAPFFKTKLVDQGVTNKQVSAVFLCLVDANPPVEVAWFKDGEELTYSDRLEVISEPSICRYQLKIRTLKLPVDFGKYLFQARNNLGLIESSCTLSAAVVPDKVSRPITMCEVNGRVWVKWNQPQNCAPHPIHFRLEYRDLGETIWVIVDAFIRETTYCLHNLKNGSSYRFRVRAENNAGVGPYSRASRRIKSLKLEM